MNKRSHCFFKVLLTLIVLLRPLSLGAEGSVANQFIKLGDEQKQKGYLDEALSCYQLATAYEPECFEAHLKSGKVFYSKRDFASAATEYMAALEVQPKNMQVLLDLGNSLLLDDKLEAAKAIFQNMILVDPKCYPALGNLARIHMQEGQIDKASNIYKSIIETAPRDKISRFNLSKVRLLQGDFPMGFPLFDIYRQLFASIKIPQFQQPLWTGKQDINGKRLLICAEEGLGDMFQFIRYAKLAKDKGAIIIAQVHKPLENILSLCPYLDVVVPSGKPLPNFDFYIPLETLIGAFRTTIDNIPAPIPYLYADEKLEKKWAEKLDHDKNFKIGLCWESEIYKEDPFLEYATKKRCIDLKLFAPLAELEGVSFYSLQKRSSADPLNTGSDKFIVNDFGPDFDVYSGAFMDSAAIMNNLDLVITVDTAIAHLAGGMGVFTWTLLPYEPNWRWFLERDDSPWYSSMKLFRQPSLNNWEDVIQKVKKELEMFLKVYSYLR